MRVRLWSGFKRHPRSRAGITSPPAQVQLLESRTLLAAISGVVTAAGDGWDHAYVTLFQADANGARQLGQDRADADGEFKISYRKADRGAFLYLVASSGPTASGELQFVGLAGQVGKDQLKNVAINEFTTVGTVFALAQFQEGGQIYGPSPGLDNAVATAFTLFEGDTGLPAAVVSNHNNGTTLSEYSRSTEALVKMNTLANMLAASAADSTGATSDLFFELATPQGGTEPTNTIAALWNISQNATTLDNTGLFELAEESSVYGPTLDDAPADWILALHFTDGGFNAPGRMAFDAKGNMWSNNNFLYIPDLYGPGQQPSLPGRQVTVLNPAGEPILGSPFYPRGVLGSGYGTAIAPDGSIWISNFDEGGIAKFRPNGKQEFFIPGTSSGLDHPMGMAFDAQGNLWIANMGDPADSSDPGSVTVYLKGNPKKAITHTGDVFKPFSVAVDGQGRVWAANSPLVGGRGVVVLELQGRQIVQVQVVDSPALSTPVDDFPLRPFSEFMSPRTIAIDSQGNAWVANFESDRVSFIDGKTFEVIDYPVDTLSRGWGLAVDGSDRIWVQSFSNPPVSGGLMEPPSISVLQGSEPGRGTLLATFSNPSLEHVTALQLDASGNVWAANNWALTSVPGDITGGDGVVKFIGISTPVKTPLIGLPKNPAETSTGPGFPGTPQHPKPHRPICGPVMPPSSPVASRLHRHGNRRLSPVHHDSHSTKKPAVRSEHNSMSKQSESSKRMGSSIKKSGRVISLLSTSRSVVSKLIHGRRVR